MIWVLMSKPRKLLHLLAGDDAKARQLVERILGEMDKDALSALLATLELPKPTRFWPGSEAHARLISQLEGLRWLPFHQVMRRSESPEVRSAVVDALASIKNPMPRQAIEFLAALARDEVGWVSVAATEAASQRPDAVAGHCMERALKTTHQGTHDIAIDRLMRMDTPASLDACVDVLRIVARYYYTRSDSHERMEYSRKFVRLAQNVPGINARLVYMMGGLDPDDVNCAALGSGLLRYQEAIPTIMAALERLAPRPDARWHGEEHVRSGVRVIHAYDGDRRFDLLRALGLMGSEEVLDILKRAAAGELPLSGSELVRAAKDGLRYARERWEGRY